MATHEPASGGPPKGGLASLSAFAIEGIDAQPTTVEVDVRRGLASFTIVGLPDATVRETRERVRAAVLNSDLKFPQQRITANLAPAGVRHAGASYDLAFAVTLLAASGQIPNSALNGIAVWGELSLGGQLRPVRGALAVARACERVGIKTLIVPPDAVEEAGLARNVEIRSVPNLACLAETLRASSEPPSTAPAASASEAPTEVSAERAVEIAAAGGHGLLLAGASSQRAIDLARLLSSLLPAMMPDEAIEVTTIQSVCGVGDGTLAVERPLRAPHHSISRPALVGGGARHLHPGEVTLAHNGVLFLDDLSRFATDAVEALIQTRTTGRVAVTSGRDQLKGAMLPARIQLVASGDPSALSHNEDLSPTVLSLFDIVCDARPGRAPDTPGNRVRAERIRAARTSQAERARDYDVPTNGALDDPKIGLTCLPRASKLIVDSIAREELHPADQLPVLRVARTIADLDYREKIDEVDVAEAIALRPTGGRRRGE